MRHARCQRAEAALRDCAGCRGDVRFGCDLVAVNGPRNGSRNQMPRAFYFSAQPRAESRGQLSTYATLTHRRLHARRVSARIALLLTWPLDFARGCPRSYSTRNVTLASTGSLLEYAFRLCPLSSAWIQPIDHVPLAACFGTEMRPKKFCPSGEGSNEK